MKKLRKIASIFAAGAMIFGVMNLMSCSSDDNGGSEEKPTAYIIDDNDTTKGFVSCTGNPATGSDLTNFAGFEGKTWTNGMADGNIILSINSPNAQDVKLSMQYGYWGATTSLRAGQVVVNEEKDDEILYFNFTNKWQKNAHLLADGSQAPVWSLTNEITIHLNKDENQIRIIPAPKGTPLEKYDAAKGYGAIYPRGETDETAAGDNAWKAEGNLANFDYIKLVGKGLSAGTNSLSFSTVKVSGDNGSITVTPDQALYAKGTKITVTAVPNSGFKFDSWCGTNVDKTGTFEIEVEKDLEFTAHFIPTSFDAATELEGLAGYGTICDDDATPYTITGGFGGTEITISSLTELNTHKSKLSGNDPYIVKVTGTITTEGNLSEKIDIGSNKTIIGGTGTNQGRFKNIMLNISGKNVIVKNLMLGEVISGYTEKVNNKNTKGKGNDALDLNGAKFVWIDHCEFQSHLSPQDNKGKELAYATAKTEGNTTETDEHKWKKDFYDGLLDIKNGSAFVTISNCYFHDHYKACLCGSSDVSENGDSKMRLTFYNNRWENIMARQPLFRYGKAHIYNSYFGSNDETMKDGGTNWQGTAINCRAGSEVYIDNNVFENIKTTIGYYNDESASQTGYWVNKDNQFDNCTNTPLTSPTTYVPPYEWTPKAASEVKDYVIANAGVKN